jgi:hypothetical protein
LLEFAAVAPAMLRRNGWGTAPSEVWNTSGTQALIPRKEPDMSTTENPKTHTFSNAEKDPDDWTTGDEKMTGAQASYLKTLSEEAGVTFDNTLTKAEASKHIDALQEKTGRGVES